MSKTNGQNIKIPKLLAVICVVVWFVGLLVIASATVEADNAKNNDHCKEKFCQNHGVHIATGQRGGTYYEIGRALTIALGEGRIGFLETQGSVENLEIVRDTNRPGNWFGIVQSDVIDYLYGRESYDNYKGFKVIGAICREQIYLLARRKLHLSSIQELRGKKVATGLTKSGTQHTSKTMLDIFGISPNEIGDVPLHETAISGKESYYVEIASLFERGQIDAAFIVNAEIPDKIKKCIDKRKAYIHKISRSDLAEMASIDPHLYRLSEVTDPIDNKKFTTISVTAILISDPNMPEEIARELTKELCKNDESGLFHKHFNEKKYSSTGTDIDWVDYPFVLYGRKDKALFDEYYKSSYKPWKYRLHRLCEYWFPVLLLVLCVGIWLIPRIRKKLNGNTFIFWTCVYLSFICLMYLLLVIFEPNIENPDITGSPKDIKNLLKAAIRLGEVFCVTFEGKTIKTLMFLLSSGFVAIMVWRSGFNFINKKIREVLKMTPKNSEDHVVICNWTSKIKQVVGELRSPVLRNKRCIIIVAQCDDGYQSDIESLREEYGDVYLFRGDPAEGQTLTSDTVNISYAHTILILTDNEKPNESYSKSKKILHLVTGLLENVKKKPNIVVEQSDPSLIQSLKDAGADNVVSYPDLMYKLLAQAVITPSAVDFVQEILTTEKKTNEVYSIEIPEGYIGHTFRDFAKEVISKSGCSLNPLLVVGIRRYGKLHVNPKKRFIGKAFTIKSGDKAVVLAWEEPKKLSRPSGKKPNAYSIGKKKALLPKIDADKTVGGRSKQKIKEVPSKQYQKSVARVEDETASLPAQE